MINFVSLGMSCQTTHQINHFVEQNLAQVDTVKSPFDWLICPPASVTAWLEGRLENFEPKDIVEYRERAYWPKYRIWFWHGFTDRAIDPPALDLPGLAEQELSRLNYLRSKFRSLDLSTTVFVVSNTQNNLDSEVFEAGEETYYRFTPKKIDHLQGSLDEFFGARANLQVVTRNDRVSRQLTGRANVHVLPVDASNWKGNRSFWGTVLSDLAR